MNKKVLVVVVALIVAFMLSSVALVLAASKEKVDFALYLRGGLDGTTQELHDNGYIVASPNNRWVLPPPPPPPPEGYVVWHYVNAPYVANFVELVVDGVTIPMDYLKYEATISGTLNWQNSFFNVKVDEKVTIYTDETKTTEWGAIEMRAVRHNYQPPQVGVIGGNFEGHGTGALAGLKVHGDAGIVEYGGVDTRSRIGTAMGWPGWP